VALILIGGGARSGKSRYAVERALAAGARRCFIATAQVFDAEMQARVDAHRQDRGGDFETVEAPIEVARAVREAAPKYDAVLVDCLTLWLSNVMLAGGLDVAAQVEALIQAARGAPTTVILVTNEVGCGIVPDNELARRFRDEAGRLNRRVAAVADEVYWMAFGCPLRVK
jgi:adenosylcobinamide kinase / adenosylcobinamide-phosphate guanylyltransferase